jgi:uncharacterized protein YbaP (TraB family)
MSPHMLEKLDDICQTLGEYIAEMRRQDLDEIAMFLAMARLSVQMKMHEISGGELKALCEAIETCRYTTRQ